MFAPSIGGLMKKKSIQMKIKKKLRSKVFLFRSFKLYTRIVDFFLTLFIFRDEEHFSRLHLHISLFRILNYPFRNNQQL